MYISTLAEINSSGKFHSTLKYVGYGFLHFSVWNID